MIISNINWISEGTDLKWANMFVSLNPSKSAGQET